METISKDELKETDDAVIINVLKEKQHRMLHIKDSQNMPLDELREGSWQSLDKDRKIVVYCASYDCQASPKAAEFLAEKGFDVADYEGGIKEWAQAGFPVEGEMSREEWLEEYA